MSEPAAPAPQRLNSTAWLIVIIASIGFAFDIYELLMLPLIVRPALLELIKAQPGSDEFNRWVGMLFYVPAFAGGLFGLLGGYLTDYLGRRAVLTWSILLYAGAAFCAGLSTSVEQLLFFRCLVFIGVCVEFVAAVAWLAELFPDHNQREKVLGYTQAFSSIGGLMVAGANGLAVKYLADNQIPEFLQWMGTPTGPDFAWRYTLMSGLIPAIPLILIRPFLPESPVWQNKRDAGTLKRPSIKELFQPALFRTTIVTTIMFACSYGAAFGAIQQLPRIIPGLPQVQEEVKEATAAAVAQKKLTGKAAEIEGKRISGQISQRVASDVTKVQELGGLVGRFALAALVTVIVSRRTLLRLFQVPGLIAMPFIFAWATTNDLTWTYIGLFVAGLVTVAQFSFWGNYLPTVYPLHLRGTGESFAANIGGRMIGTSFAWVTVQIAAAETLFPAGTPETARTAYTAAGVALFVYLVGIIASFWLPEPKPGALDDEGGHGKPA